MARRPASATDAVPVAVPGCAWSMGCQATV